LSFFIVTSVAWPVWGIYYPANQNVLCSRTCGRIFDVLSPRAKNDFVVINKYYEVQYYYLTVVPSCLPPLFHH
jgi:hypothetical protein